MKEEFVWIPGIITRLERISAGELTIVEITLPHKRGSCGNGKGMSVIDSGIPGSAFFAQPRSMRTGAPKRRWYSRSNCLSDKGVLQTIINKKKENPDTSWWWQTTREEYEQAPEVGDTIMVCAHFVRLSVPYNFEEERVLTPYAPPIKRAEQSLALELPECFSMHYLGLGFYTGVTPLLAHVRFLAECRFGHAGEANYTLIVSVRDPSLLMFHDELLAIERKFPDNFRYIPVATREAGVGWTYPCGRIIQVRENDSINLDPLLTLVPDLGEWHIRLCGGKEPRDQLMQGLQEYGINPPSFKAEVW